MLNLNRISYLISSLLLAGSCSGLGNIDSDGLADRNGLVTDGGTCTVLQRIGVTDEFNDYTQDRLNSAAHMNLGRDFSDLTREMVPGFFPVNVGELPVQDYTYRDPETGSATYPSLAEYIDQNGNYCSNIYFSKLDVQLVECWDKPYGEVRQITSQTILDSEATYYNLDGTSKVETAGVVNGSGEAIYFYDQDEDGNLDNYRKEYIREGLIKSGTIPDKFDPSNACSIVKNFWGKSKVINQQSIQYSTTELGLETLRLDHEGHFKCERAMPKGWACAEGYNALSQGPDGGGGGDHNGGGQSDGSDGPNGGENEGGRE